MEKPAVANKTDLSSRKETNSVYMVRLRPVRYGPCQKNQAVTVRGFALDGCQEFMAAGVEGTPEAFICVACGCNRSFHRKYVQMEMVDDCCSPPPEQINLGISS